MPLDRLQRLISGFRAQISNLSQPTTQQNQVFSRQLGRELLESMLQARYLDLAAHELRAQGHGHYTICSTGHEGNVVLGRLTHPTDPSILHYRSAALQLERARQIPQCNAVRDIALSLVASSEEPTSGGRHKVFGGKHLGIIPSTSTIASHLPRAMGLAFGLEHRKRLRLTRDEPEDAIALCSFGDASLNHSTALGALNAVSWSTHQNLPLPILFVCEDNGLGISVRTPEGWVETRLKAEPHLKYFSSQGWDLFETWRTATEAVQYVRRQRRPAILHLKCVRLLGHAGSDVDATYRTTDEINAAESRDPILCAARDLITSGTLNRKDVLELDAAVAETVRVEAEAVKPRPKLTHAAQVMAALTASLDTKNLELAATSQLKIPESQPLTLAQGINAALTEILERHPGALLFGEDVAKKGGVYGITKGLFPKFGALRVFNTLLDEQTILGLALGASTLGLLPIPEIQYLAYLHNAEDQLRGEAATMSFFSQQAYDNPMIVRIAGLAYQKGFGGHFHNDNSLSVLRDIPGIVLAVPARGDDAVELYRTAAALATEARRVVVIVEPIALYHTKDLLDGDATWVAPAPAGAAAWLRARVYHADHADLVIATYGNGLWLSLRAAEQLKQQHGIRARVLDLRWLAPLPVDDVLTHAAETGRLLVVDECRHSGNISEALAAAMLDAQSTAHFARINAKDSFIPLGDAANLVLISEQQIIDAARCLV